MKTILRRKATNLIMLLFDVVESSIAFLILGISVLVPYAVVGFLRQKSLASAWVVTGLEAVEGVLFLIDAVTVVWLVYLSARFYLSGAGERR